MVSFQEQLASIVTRLQVALTSFKISLQVIKSNTFDINKQTKRIDSKHTRSWKPTLNTHRSVNTLTATSVIKLWLHLKLNVCVQSETCDCLSERPLIQVT